MEGREKDLGLGTSLEELVAAVVGPVAQRRRDREGNDSGVVVRRRPVGSSEEIRRLGSGKLVREPKERVVLFLHETFFVALHRDRLEKHFDYARPRGDSDPAGTVADVGRPKEGGEVVGGIEAQSNARREKDDGIGDQLPPELDREHEVGSLPAERQGGPDDACAGETGVEVEAARTGLGTTVKDLHARRGGRLDVRHDRGVPPQHPSRAVEAAGGRHDIAGFVVVIVVLFGRMQEEEGPRSKEDQHEQDDPWSHAGKNSTFGQLCR